MPICITGMHRSGTSMVANMLRHCGLDLGPESEMIPAAPDNSEGFWENRHFVAVNDRVLESLGGGWDLPPEVPSDWTRLPNWQALCEQANAGSRFFTRSVWGWKDPRVSVLVRFWLAAVPDLKVVVCLRNPLDVADSLKRRGGSSIAFGLRLWKEYNHRLLRDIPKERCLVTHYDAYFSDAAAEIRRVATWAGLSADEAQIATACGTLRPGLRHTASGLRPLMSASADRTVVSLYLQLCANAGPAYAEVVSKNSEDAHIAANSGLASPKTLREIDQEAAGTGPTRDALCEALIDRDAWRQEALRVWDVQLQLSRRLEHTERLLDEARNEALAIRSTRLWRSAELAVAMLSTFKPSRNSAAKPAAASPETLTPSTATPAKPATKAPAKPKSTVNTLPSDPGYLARQVWIVMRAHGISGVWEAWRKRRQMIRMLQDISDEGAGVSSAAPLVSIVIPVFNNVELTNKCVQSILRNSPAIDYEIIVVDNASTDGTEEWARQMTASTPCFRYIRNASNLGFGMAVNVGADAAHGKYVLVANNDLIMSPGWLSEMLTLAQSSDDLGVVSPVTNFAGETPQMLQEFAHMTDREVDTVAAELARRAAEPREVPDRLVFFCVMVPRVLWRLIGGLSASYGKGNFEDDDFCLRVRLLGYRLIICQRSFVFHYGSQTFAKQNIPHQLLMKRNAATFHGRLAEFAQTPLPFRSPRPATTAQPLFSLIVRTVDRPAYLTEALQSLTTQLCNDFEVIVVNDGGPDASPVLNKFAGMLRLRQIRHERSKGRSAAWNTGIRAATGRFVCQLDDDDIVYPNHFAAFADAIAANPQGKLFYADSTRALYEMKKGVGVFLQRQAMPVFEAAKEELQVQDVMPIMTFVVARELYAEIGYVNESLEFHEDWDVLIRLAARADFHHVRRTTSEYRFRFNEEGMDNSTLRNREESLRGLLATYERYPAKEPGVKQKRDYLIGALQLQIRDLANIRASDRSSRDKAFASICLIAGFEPG